jgi:hypothetical protein
MKDCIGREIKLDDSVIIIAPRYRTLVLARVVKLTPKQVRVRFINDWNYCKPGREEELLQFPSQMCKVDGPDLTMYLLKKD